MPNSEYGNVYVSAVKNGTHQIENPLALQKEKQLDEILDNGA